MATVDIYGMPPSAPCRILYMTCNALGVEYNDIPVDLFNGENKTPEYLKVIFFFCFFKNIWYATDGCQLPCQHSTYSPGFYKLNHF